MKLRDKPEKSAFNAKEKNAAPERALTFERNLLDIDRRKALLRFGFKDVGGQPNYLDVPRKLMSDPAEIVKHLLDAGADLSADKKVCAACVTNALANLKNSIVLNLTRRAGWYSDKGAVSFVLHKRTYGPAKNTLQFFSEEAEDRALGMRSGTLENWRAGLQEPCKVSDELVVAIAISASGPLYFIIGNAEPAVYDLHGAPKPPGDNREWKSSSGKTLVARAGQSTFTAAARTDLHTMNMTDVAVEEACYASNDLALYMDELGTAGEGASGKHLALGPLIYRIISGKGRKRSKAYTRTIGLANLSWICPVVMTSEDELDAGKSLRKEGHQVRMVAIPFAPTWDGGTFHRISDPLERSRLAKLVEDTISDNYGVAIPKYIANLVKYYPSLATDITKIRDEFVEGVGAARNSFEKRFAEKFGILMAAAVLMVRYEIAPWDEARAKEAITAVYKRSRSATVSIPEVTNRLLDELREAVRKRDRFPRLTKGGTLSLEQQKKAWGVIRKVGDEKNVAVMKSASFRRRVHPPAAADVVLDELAKRDLVVRSPDGNLKYQLAVKGLSKKRPRYICIRGLVSSTVKRSKV